MQTVKTVIIYSIATASTDFRSANIEDNKLHTFTSAT